MGIIRMDTHFYDEMIEYARKHLPEETCGLIVGTEDEEGRFIKKVYFYCLVPFHPSLSKEAAGYSTEHRHWHFGLCSL